MSQANGSHWGGRKPQEQEVHKMTNPASSGVVHLAHIGQMAAGVAHEIRNPLTAVKGFLQLLQEDAPHPYVDVAQTELDRAINIVQELLQVAKPDTVSEPFTPVSLFEELEFALYLFQNQAYRVPVDKHFADTDCKIFGKRNQLKKTFFNLLKNAFEAVQTEGHIVLRHQRVGHSIQVVIEDSGVGMSKETLDMLGTPFFSTKDDGTGMGMAQVYSTMHQHGGTIQVQSAPGRGTSFVLEFPMSGVENVGGMAMELEYQSNQTFWQFYEANRQAFQKSVSTSATTVISYLNSQGASLDDMYNTIDGLIKLLMEGNVNQLIVLAKSSGRTAGKEDYPVALLFELIECSRHTLWEFLYEYHRHVAITTEEAFQLERRINNPLDRYITHYFASYFEYRNDVLQSHREALDELSVPVIPLAKNVAILPLVGTVDTHRAKQIQEKALRQIADLRLEHIVIDVSGVAFLDTAVVSHLFRIIDGISLLGCEATITGIRPEIANTMITMGISLHGKVTTKATLQQALEALNV